jgi:hypothetical protein
MLTRRTFLVAAVLVGSAIGGLELTTGDASAALFRYRQRYSSWSYYPTRTYYYRSYYYKPVSSYSGYKYHYCIHYPSRPRYIYYYNPVRKVYWGRYDLEDKGYSMLEEKDRKGDLDSIPESAFPKPGEMPVIPESEDGVQIERPSADDLPSGTPPEDAPGDGAADAPK